MSRIGQDVTKSTRIPQPIGTVQTAFVSPRLRMSNRPFCKQLTPSRAIFESKKLKSACSFLRQLKEKLESDDSTSEFEQKHNALGDIINTLFDVNDAITPILNSASSAFISLEAEPVFLSKEFDDAMDAASKIYEVTKQIREEVTSEESMCYFSKQIIANNYEQINTFKENLSVIGDRIYVDKELVKQLADLHILLKDTIRKLKEKELQFKSSGSESQIKLIKKSGSGRSVKVDPSAPETRRQASILSGDMELPNEFSSSRYTGLEEITAKPENKTYFVKCTEYLDLLKTCLQKVMVGGTCEYGEIKIYKDKRRRLFDELCVNVDGTALIIQVTKTRQGSKLSIGEVKDKKGLMEKPTSDDNKLITIDQNLEPITRKCPRESQELRLDKSKEKTVPVGKSTSDKKDISTPKESKAIPTPDKRKEITTPKESKAIPAPDKRKEVSTPKESKAIPVPDKRKKDKNKIYSSYCYKKKKGAKLQQIRQQDSKPNVPYTAEMSSLPMLADEQVCPSRDLDVKKQKSTLRQLGINHPDANVASTLKQIPVDYLLMSCRPAKCCRKVVLNEKPRAKFPYAASLRSLPLMQKDLDKVKELVQSNVHFLDSCTTFDAYVNFQKNASEKLLYFCNAPISIEVRFFEIFKREFSKTNLTKPPKTKTTQNNYEIKILDFLRKFYSREPLPTEKTQKRSKKPKRKNPRSKQSARSKSRKRSTLRAKLTPQFSFSSSSFISSKFTIGSKEEKSKSSYSFLLVPKTKVTSYISKEITTYEHTKNRQSKSEDEETTTTTSNVLEDLNTGSESQAALDVSSLSPANYAETLNAIYELDEEGNIRTKNKFCPHKIEVSTQRQDDHKCHVHLPEARNQFTQPKDDHVEVVHKCHLHLHESRNQLDINLNKSQDSHLRLHEARNQLEINLDKSQDTVSPMTNIESPESSSESKGTSVKVDHLYKVSATNVIGPEVTGSLGIRSGPEKILKAAEPNLCTIYEVEESKRTEAGDEIYQQRCDMCQKLMVENFSDKSMSNCNNQSRSPASESGDSISRIQVNRKNKKQQMVVSSGSSTPRLLQSKSCEKATLLQMNLNEVIHKLNYQNIYHVNTNQTQTIRRHADIPSGPIFETTALTHTKQISVQTSQTEIVESEIPMYLGPTTQTDNPEELPTRLLPARILPKKTRALPGHIREDMVEMKHKQTESIIHEVKLNGSYMVKKKRGLDRIQIEKNVLAYVINPKKMKSRKEQLEPKYFPSSTRGSSAKSFKRTSFQNVNNLKRINHDMESKCEMVCSWPPKRPQAICETMRNAFFISVHGSDGEDAHQKQAVKSSSEEIHSRHSDDGLQRKDVNRPKTERIRRSKRQSTPTYNNQNYVIGFVGPSGGEVEAKATKCNHHRHRKEKLKRKKLKRIPEIIDVTMSKHIARNMLEYPAINDQNVPGFVTVLSTPCDCPDVTIFIPCFCGNYKCDRCKVSRFTRNKATDYTMIPLINQDSVYSYE